MKYQRFFLLPLLGFLLFSSCKREVLTDELRELLLDKTWKVQSVYLEVEGDTTYTFQYGGSIGLLSVVAYHQGNLVLSDSVYDLYEEWTFDESLARSGREELRQPILPYFSDSTCRPLAFEQNDYLSAGWLPLDGTNPGQFMSFSLFLPVQYVPDNVPWSADPFLFLRGETTWYGDTMLDLNHIVNDPAAPNSPYTFNIRLVQLTETGCPDPDYCEPWLADCANGSYDWRRCGCICEPGWRGAACDELICSNPPPCVNGTAVPQGQNCRCECEEGWAGVWCNEPVVTSLDCDTSTVPCVNGTRVASEDSLSCECQCYPGWQGSDCSLTQVKAVTTLAGNGTAGLTNGVGSNATFHEPRGMVTDAAGNIYLADAANHVIRRITPGGVVTTFAGTGTAGYLDGPGDVAMFHNPSDITRDLEGNFYVADHFNHVIRKITPTGVVSTLAGNGSPGTTNADLATSAFSNPFAIVWDKFELLGPEVLLVADRGTNIIRKVDLSVGAVSDFAGTFNPFGANVNGPAATARFGEITGMAFSSEGALFLADRGNDAVRRISISNGQADQVGTFAGRLPNGNVIGMAANDPLRRPSDVVWQFPDLVYVTDSDNHRIRLMVENVFGFGNTQEVAGSLQNQAGFVDDTGSNARFDLPFGLCIDFNNVIYVSETGNNSIRKLE